MNPELPVVVIGAGPVGLAAAAHLQRRGLPAVVLEAGATVGAGVRTWSHVRMFSPWHYSIDTAARTILDAAGWAAPDAHGFPTGGELATHYLEPLARALKQDIRLNARVIAIGRETADRMKDQSRAAQPFVVRYQHLGEEHELYARAVIDASGTIRQANPLGANGLPARNEHHLSAHIRYGIPDVLGTDRERYVGKRIAVVGSGHSAQNIINDLARLADEARDTRIHWVIRQSRLARVLGGGLADQLAERGRLGLRVRALVDADRLTVHTGFHVRALQRAGEGVVLMDRDRSIPEVDEVIVATGFRPDFSFLDELRLDIDPTVQSTRALAPLIDPNQHSCGSVRPHGAKELGHPEGGVYLVGMKSYGRAPTFLLLTGHEQVRSVVADIAGDHDAAARVELVLPETGVCITDWGDEPTVGSFVAAAKACCGPNVAPTAKAQEATEETRPQFAPDPSRMQPQTESVAASCCGGPSTQDGNCCVLDDISKASGKEGCGCSAPPKTASTTIRSASGCCA